MAFLNGTLQLLEPASPRGRRMPIDFFLRSLAHDQRERAIKGESGMVMVQNPGVQIPDRPPSEKQEQLVS